MKFWVIASNLIVLKAEYLDLKNKLLKTQTLSDYSQIDGIWTRNRLQIENHQTGHQTRFVFTDVDYQTEIEDDLFTKRALERGQ